MAFVHMYTRLDYMLKRTCVCTYLQSKPVHDTVKVFCLMPHAFGRTNGDLS